VSSLTGARSATSQAVHWTRRGLLLGTPTGQPWAASHAALPTVEQRADGELWLYYSPRDERGRAHIASARLEADESGTLRVTEHHPEPVLAPGELGAFDDAGVTVSCVVAGGEGQGTLLYYTGWALGVSVPFYFYAGLARRAPGERSFVRVSKAPILERSEIDPFLTASPWVLREQGQWHMWYIGCSYWEPSTDGEGPPRHYYHVRYAHSGDGVDWQRDGEVALDFQGEHEYAMGRPCVLRDGDRYRMWLCARGDSYRLAYAESADGRHWERDDSRVSLTGDSDSTGDLGDWEREMQAYPAVFDDGGRRYLLYNGNGYGRSGIGYATLEAED
jgi:hypothetical protein